MPVSLLQVVSVVGGALVGGVFTAYASKQSRKQSEIIAMLQALQQDNKDLREENRMLREELSKHRSRSHESKES